MTTKQQDDKTLAEKYPNAWVPVHEGDRLEGTVVGVRRAWSDARAKNNPDGWYPLLQIETGDGVVLAFHAFTTVTYNEVVDQQPRPGERIVVTYQGLGRARDGMNAPKLFSLTLPGRDPKEAADAVYGKFTDRTGAQVQTGASSASAAPPPSGAGEPDELPF